MSLPNDVGVGGPLSRLFGLPALLAAILFVVSASVALDVPGVYMDAVNPDYMIVRLLSPAGVDPAVWVLPGQLVLGKFPVLGQLYSGALTFYLGLPVYLLIGTDLLGIRIAEIGFGLFVLLGIWLFLRAFEVRPWIAALGVGALALDPAFVMSFRTQAYITLLPLGLLLLSLAILGPGMPAVRRRPAATLVASGGLAGLAFYGYFFYLFPALTVLLYLAWAGPSEIPGRRRLALWSLGFACGASPYLLGYLLMLGAIGDFTGLLAYLKTTLGPLEVARSSLGMAGRARFLLDMSDLVFFNKSNSLMLLHAPGRPHGLILRTGLLVAMPAAVLALGALARRPVSGLASCAGFATGFVVLALVFGDRLWAHHFAAIVPIVYVGFIIALDRIATTLPWLGARCGLVAAAIVPLAFVNGINHQVFASELRATGGVGLASDAIVRFAEQSQPSVPRTHFFFPDWGVFMPFAMITSGRLPYETGFQPEAARRELCTGHDVVLALVHAAGDSRLDGWTRSVDWGAPSIEAYRQRDGTIVLDVARWKAGDRPASVPACG